MNQLVFTKGSVWCQAKALEHSLAYTIEKLIARAQYPESWHTMQPHEQAHFLQQRAIVAATLVDIAGECTT